jgi:hypothetical protein
MLPVLRISFGVGALKSPFVKGDLGGFSSAYEIPPGPPLKKGGRGTGTVRFPPQPIGFYGMQSRSPSDRWLRTFWMKIAQFRLSVFTELGKSFQYDFFEDACISKPFFRVFFEAFQDNPLAILGIAVKIILDVLLLGVDD